MRRRRLLDSRWGGGGRTSGASDRSNTPGTFPAASPAACAPVKQERGGRGLGTSVFRGGPPTEGTGCGEPPGVGGGHGGGLGGLGAGACSEEVGQEGTGAGNGIWFHADEMRDSGFPLKALDIFG